MVLLPFTLIQIGVVMLKGKREEVLLLLSQGNNMSEIGRMLKISKQRVSQIAKGPPLLKERLCALLTCSKKFTTKTSRKYCNDKCRSKANYTVEVAKSRICEKCGKQFSRLWGSKYCHNPCK